MLKKGLTGTQGVSKGGFGKKPWVGKNREALVFTNKKEYTTSNGAG